jgi:diguanylate cyclase (GGDEF)-like protein/PAS domain S-box-containing protein
MELKSFSRPAIDSPSDDERIIPLLFAGNPLPMWLYDIGASCFLEVNESAERQYGYTREEFLSLNLSDIAVPQNVPILQAVHPGGRAATDSTRIHRKKDGTQIYVKVCANDIFFHGRQMRFVVAEDITEQRHLHAHLLQLAHHDALTGLPNRILLEQRMNRGFATARAEGHRAAIICLDVDRFKQVNDWYGHAIGDECLKRVGSLLTRRLRGMDTVARTGGEEFTIILGEVENVASAGIVAKALLQAFSAPMEIEGHRIILGASLGVAVYPDHGIDAAELLRSADAAMYRAKRAGGNRHEFVGSFITTAAAEVSGVDAHMRTMLQAGELQLHYQLQYNMSGRIRGMEALLRLPDPDLGFVSPDRFITIAEESGLIHLLGKWVIEEACRQLVLWNTDRETPVCIAVNISPLQLMRPDFIPEIRQAISSSGINPAWLEMEITERVVLNINEIAGRMTELADLGIRFAVDDFGTGYSSLQHLHRLPVSTLKIDRSFVRQLCESSRSYSIVKSIIAMGHSLQMEVIAEGVEHEDQIRVLRELHCDCLQGFLLSRPSPPETLEALLGDEVSIAGA